MADLVSRDADERPAHTRVTGIRRLERREQRAVRLECAALDGVVHQERDQ
jgi:hypothetical protein